MNRARQREIQAAFSPRTYINDSVHPSGRPGVGATIDHPLFSEPVRYTVDVVPDNPDQQVEFTLGKMRQLAVEDSATTEVRQLAAGLRGVDDRDTVHNVWESVKGRMRFLDDARHASPLNVATPDAPVIETLVRPVDVLRAGGAGDCDDFSMLAASLLRVLDIRVVYATVAADPRDPGVYSHVYPVAYTRAGERIAVDASHGPYCGWEAPNRFGKRREWPLEVEVYPLLLVALVIGLVGQALAGRFW